MKKGFLLKLTLLLSAMMTMMAGAVVAPSLPQINMVFAETPKAGLLSRLVITLPALFIAFFSPLYGQLIDRTGRKVWLLIALVIYAIAGTSGYFLTSLHYILIGRAILGIAVAGIMTISTTLVGDYFQGKERSSFLGIQGAFIGLGGVFFISVAGILADIHWQMPFLIYLFAIPVLIMASLFLYEPKMGISNNSENLSNASIKYNKFLILIIYVTVFFAIVGFYMVPVQIPYILKDLEGITNSQIGYAISISTLFSAIVSMNYKSIKSKLSFSRVYALSFFLMAIGYFFIYKSSEYYQFVLSLSISGAGVGLLMPTGSLWVMEIAPDRIRGRLISGVSTSMFLGMFFSPIIIQPIIERRNSQSAFFIASIGLLVLSFCYMIFMNKFRNSDKINS